MPLADTIEKVVEELEKKAPAEEKPEIKIDAQEDDEQPEEDDEPPSEEDLSEEQAEEAKRLYQALRSPQASAVIAALAQQAGILNKPIETKAEERIAKKEIKEIIREHLGESYKFLADQLGPAIEAVLTQERQTQESRFAEIQSHRLEQDVIQSFTNLSRETKGESKKYEAKMTDLSQEVPIGNMSVDRYIQVLYTLATAGRKEAPKGNMDKIRRNANDAPSRLQGNAQGRESSLPNKKMNINESIDWALGQITKGKV